jgi:transposase
VAFFVARELTLGCARSVIDAREVRLKAHRPTQKSDRRDAFELCDGLRRGIYRAVVHVPPPAVSRVRETLARRRHFVRLETAQSSSSWGSRTGFLRKLTESPHLGRSPWRGYRDLEPTTRRSDQQAEHQSDDRLHLASIPPRPPLPLPAIRSSR